MTALEEYRTLRAVIIMEKGGADGRGQGFDDPLIDVAIEIDEEEHEEEADARFDPDIPS